MDNREKAPDACGRRARWGMEATETLLQCYQRLDEETLYAVVAEERVSATTGKPW